MFEALSLFFHIFIGIIFLLFPSLLIIHVLAPKFSAYEQLLLSVPVSISILSVFVTVINLFNIPFNFLSYLIFALLVIGGYLVYYIKWNHGIVDLRSSINNFNVEKADLGYFCLIIISILIMLGILLIGFQGFLVPPSNDDGSVHNRFISLIFEKQNVFQVFQHSIYPYGYHVTVALLMGIIPIPGYQLSLYVIIFLTSLFPAALFFLIYKIYNNKEIAAFTALLSPGFFLFPFSLYTWGGYALILGTFFIPFVAAVSYLSIKENDLRLALLSGILVTGAFFVHPSEIMTVSVFLFVLIAFLLPIKTYFRSICKNLLIPIAFAGILVAAIRPSLILLVLSGKTGVNRLGPPVSIQSALHNSFFKLFDYAQSYFILCLFLLGLIVILYYRKYLEILVIQIIFFALYLDISTLQVLQPFYNFTSPWSEPERILYIQYFFILFIAGVGLYYLLLYLDKKGLSRFNKFVNIIFIGGIVLCFLYGSIFITIANIQSAKTNWVAVTQDDMNVMNWIGNNIPADETILNDYNNDGGVWIFSVSNRNILLPVGDAYPDKLYLVNHISEVPYNQEAAELLNNYNITYVYYGAKILPTLNRERIFSLSNILSNPHFSIAYHNGSAYLLKYNGLPRNLSNEIQYNIRTSNASPFITDGFYPAEGTFGWTSELSTVKIERPKKDGSFLLQVQTGGYRPENNPANVTFSMNGHFIGTMEKTSGTEIYSVVIPEYFLESNYQILEIRTNTWKPGDYGSADSRDLGISVDWIRLDDISFNEMFEVESWNSVPTRWMSNNATLLIYADENRTANLTFRAVSFYQPRTLEIYNGDKLQTTRRVIPLDFADVSTQFSLRKGENTIRLYIPGGCDRPRDVPELSNSDTRCLSIAVQNVTLS